MKARPLYHGGPAGLRVGDVIRPAISTGKEHAPAPHQPHYSPDKVYVTSDREMATWFAAHQADGAVYEVLPVGRLTADMDARDSWSCSAAEIVVVHEMLPADTDAITARINHLGGGI